MTRLFVDECVAGLIVTGLIERGFDVADARKLCRGDSDDRALALAAATGRILVTEDRGFGELAIRHAHPAAGVIVLVLHSLQAPKREEYAIKSLLGILDRAEGYLTIIEPGRIRARPLPSRT